LLGLLGILAITAGFWAPAPAGATFSGAQNGNVAFASICDSNTGQAVYSLNPNGSPPPTYTCPGGTSPTYTQSTAGSIDSMPYFSSQGTTLYFSSDRPASGNNPGANGNFAIYQVAYPPTVTGAAGSQSDGAVQITFPAVSGGTSNDYAPTVSSDGSELAFLRCNSGTTSCALYTQSPIIGGTPTLVTTAVAPLQPNSVSGEASRPEIDPTDPSQILYVGTDNHIHLVSLASPATFAERDLSSESGITSGQIDEYPDWNPAGTRIIFDRSHSVYVLNPTSGPATACALWGASDPGTEIEPVFAPTDTATSSLTTCNPTGNSYVWTKLGGGSNIILDMGHSVGNPATLVDLTNNRTNNSQPAWQPVPLGSQTPEVPVAVILPAAGGALLAGAVMLEWRRRRTPSIQPASA
jgi:Tol biopolymer transport system component